MRSTEGVRSYNFASSIAEDWYLRYWEGAVRFKSLFLIFPIALFVQVALAQHEALPVKSHSVKSHSGICDASGVVSLADHKFIVADDERNVLLVYDLQREGPSLQEYSLNKIFVKAPKVSSKKSKKKDKSNKQDSTLPRREIDVEAAARIGDDLFWISSHARKKSGEKAGERMRFFSVALAKPGISLVARGKPYSHLLKELFRDKRYKKFHLKDAAKIAPNEEGGLNIEGLTAQLDGSLLIGFRSPLIDGRALVVPFLNPSAVFDGKTRAEFGDPILLNLNKKGIRGMATLEGNYFIIANDPIGADHAPALYKWGGKSADVVQQLHVAFGDFNPEAVEVLCDQSGEKCKDLLLLSDDGASPVGGVRCKDLKDSSKKHFRSLTISIP